MKSPEIQPKIKEFNRLRDKGWSISEASKQIGLSYSQVYYVLRGDRESARVLRLLDELPHTGRKLHRGRKPLAFLAALTGDK